MTNLREYCAQTYGFTYIPIYLYQKSELIWICNGSSVDIMPPDEIRIDLLAGGPSLHIKETRIHSYYGLIRLPGDTEYIVLGPVSPTKYTEAILQKFFYEYRIFPSMQEAYINHLLMIPSCTYHAFKALLRQMYQGLTGEVWDTLQEGEREKADTGIREISEKFPEHFMNSLELSRYNNLYAYENLTTHFFVNGDLEGLADFANSAPPMNWGHYSDDPREDQVVFLVITMYNMMRNAIQGGMDQQMALSLMEYHIQQGLKLSQAAEVSTYTASAALDFVEKIRESLAPKKIQRTVDKCIQYIHFHVYSKITVSDVADFAGYSLEHFSRLFKKELGYNVNQYITACKLYEAQKLLRTTELPISEISSLLCFADQSYFQRQFKKQFQMTPVQYRNAGGEAMTPSMKKALSKGGAE